MHVLLVDLQIFNFKSFVIHFGHKVFAHMRCLCSVQNES